MTGGDGAISSTVPHYPSVGISGWICSGKTTAAAWFCARGFTVLSLAAPIKVLGEAARCQQWDYAEHWLRLLCSDEGDFSRAARAYSRLAGEYEEELASGVKPREFLQELGGVFREEVHPEVWVDFLLSQVAACEGPVVVDDLRCPTEAERMRAAGWRLLRLQVGNVEWLRRIGHCYPNMDMKRLQHYSEHALDDWEFDCVVDSSEWVGMARQLQRFLAADLVSNQY